MCLAYDVLAILGIYFPVVTMCPLKTVRHCHQCDPLQIRMLHFLCVLCWIPPLERLIIFLIYYYGLWENLLKDVHKSFKYT